jgi:hypothetical protein
MTPVFLVEGERSEPKIYKKWVAHTFPQLTFVNDIEDITTNSYCIFSSGGYRFLPMNLHPLKCA